MAKGKKSKKEDPDSELESEEEIVEEKPSKGKKDKKKKKDADVEEIEKDMDELDINDGKKAKNKKKAKKTAPSNQSDSEDDQDVVQVQKSAFSLLMGDDASGGDSDPDDEPEEEEPVKQAQPPPEKKGKKKKGKGGDPVDEDNPKEEKGKKKKKKKKDEDDEDLDAMLAALRAEYNDESAPPGTETAFASAPEEGGKKKKGKKEKPTDAAEDAGFEVIDADEDAPTGGTVKTAAQKKKEKKEKQKQKLEEEKKKAALQQSKQKEAPASSGGSKEASVDKDKEATSGAADKEKEDPKEEGDEEAPTTDKKGKKKKGKKDEEEKKSKVKKPNKAVVAAMQEVLAKQREEEERLARDAEERERQEEERIKQKEEQKRLEEERRQAKKEREKAKKAELKAQGKLLTPAQKAAKARAEAMLEAMRAQGIDVPAVGEKRGPRPGTRLRNKNKKSPHSVPAADSGGGEEAPKEEKPVEPVQEETKAEANQAADAEDEIKDAWDADSEPEVEPEPEPKTAAPPQVEVVVQEQEDNEEDEDEDEDSDESDSDEDDSDEDSEDDDDDDEEEDMAEAEKKRKRAMDRIQRRKEENEKKRSTDVLRSPVVCVLGHVDTGKTKILDKLRRTNVQDGEAGGITQQIGATNVPISVIQEQCKMVPEFVSNPLKLPGLLIIDTPGHESFSNLRDRGSSLCDIAILVVDIMHGLEPQTIESINLLKKKKTPFVVALNKIDRLYEWKPNKHKDVREVLENQQHNTRMEFNKRKDEVILGLAEQGLNAALFWENPDPTDYISLVPTSAHSGDGMGNLMAMLVQMSQTFLAKRLSYTEELQATVLEVKAIGGFGTTIDIVLVNGRLKFGSTLILTGTDGPIVTTVKALLTPSKMQDLRVKTGYMEHKELQAAQGVKIAAKELEKVIAGLSMRVALHPDEIDILKEEAENDLKNALNAIKLKERGVFVQASTLGSLEALLEFLKTSKIPYAGVRIGPVVKRDVMRASTMLEHDEKYAVILAFDVKVERDAQEMADRERVQIFQADIIYHLFDRFNEYNAELVRQKKEQFRSVAVFPCKLKILKEHVYMSRDPIVCGVKVEAGTVRTGTPICVPSKDFCYIGICTGIQHNSKDVESARKGDEVCVKIEAVPGEAPKMFGRHFDETDILTSKISRASIDACKDYFRDELQKTDWLLMVELKKLFEIL